MPGIIRRTAHSFLSRLTVTSISLICKASLSLPYCKSVRVSGLENLVEALESEERSKGKGVVTVCNHISTLDEPLIWGVLPARYYLSEKKTRWTLGASDIIFTNPVFSAFFRKGQVLETFRGKGIFQPAVDTAIEKVNDGGWVHLFSEGKINQITNLNAKERQQGSEGPGGRPLLLKFKWGVGRIIMEAQQPPVVIPMWITGFETLMPDGRPFPWKYFPRPGAKLSITFGRPIPEADIQNALVSSLRDPEEQRQLEDLHGSDPRMADQAKGTVEEEVRSIGKTKDGWLGAATRTEKQGSDVASSSEEGSNTRSTSGVDLASESARIRSSVTAIIHREVEKLGRLVYGLPGRTR